MQAKAASDARLARDIQEAEDRAEANAAEEARLRQQELESIDRYSQRIIYRFLQTRWQNHVHCTPLDYDPCSGSNSHRYWCQLLHNCYYDVIQSIVSSSFLRSQLA